MTLQDRDVCSDLLRGREPDAGRDPKTVTLENRDLEARLEALEAALFRLAGNCQALSDNARQRIDTRTRSVESDSIQVLTRLASATRVYLPSESRSTITTLRPSITASITRHLPASAM
jgi:hypothetical protein